MKSDDTAERRDRKAKPIENDGCAGSVGYNATQCDTMRYSANTLCAGYVGSRTMLNRATGICYSSLRSSYICHLLSLLLLPCNTWSSLVTLVTLGINGFTLGLVNTWVTLVKHGCDKNHLSEVLSDTD